jgi:hypothetical protein
LPRSGILHRVVDLETRRARSLGLHWVIDGHMLDAGGEAMSELDRLWTEGWIEISRTSVMDTELGEDANEERRERLMALSARYPEMLSVLVLGHARLGHAVWGSDEDARIWDELWELLWPGRDRATARKQHVRDALNVWSARRNGADGFVTRDQQLLARAGIVSEYFDGFLVVNPDRALDITNRGLARWHHRSSPSS